MSMVEHLLEFFLNLGCIFFGFCSCTEWFGKVLTHYWFGVELFLCLIMIVIAIEEY